MLTLSVPKTSTNVSGWVGAYIQNGNDLPILLNFGTIVPYFFMIKAQNG